MNDSLSPSIVLAIGVALVVANLWISFYGGGTKMGRAEGDRRTDRYTTLSVMLALIGVVLAIQLSGLYRRVRIAAGTWAVETPFERALDAIDFVPANSTTLFAGAALVFVGIALRVWAIHTLGHLYTFEVGIRRSHRLIREGPYAWIRHPAYAGSVVTLAGVSVSNAFSLGLVLSIVLISIVYGLRIRNEEATLVDEFGDAYRAYAARTKRLVPFAF